MVTVSMEAPRIGHAGFQILKNHQVFLAHPVLQ
jgi:hypothetical protein